MKLDDEPLPVRFSCPDIEGGSRVAQTPLARATQPVWGATCSTSKSTDCARSKACPRALPPLPHPVACDGGASATTPAPNRTASPLAISVLILAASSLGDSLRHQFENRDFRLVSHQLLGVVGDHAPGIQGQCRAVVVAVPDLAKTLLPSCWLTTNLSHLGQYKGEIEIFYRL